MNKEEHSQTSPWERKRRKNKVWAEKARHGVQTVGLKKGK